VPSPLCERAIQQAIQCRKALLKFISPNNVGLTGSHECGFYLPKHAWELFTPHPPIRGSNEEHAVEAIWQDGRVTNSFVKWYGRAKQEYRLTRFGHDFPFLDPDCVGNLLVLIPDRLDRFFLYVFDLEEDIEDIQVALGLEIEKSWAVFNLDAETSLESEDDCLNRIFRGFAEVLRSFPPTQVFAEEARNAVFSCVRNFDAISLDDQLLEFVRAEYRLFQISERRLCEPEIVRIFKSVDDFLTTAQTILQRRKSRAGRSLEHHVEFLLHREKIPFDIRIDVDGTKPDVLIPSRKHYLDPEWPTDRLFVLGLKTTCKDRWRQVLKEAPRVPQKHILTLQKGISSNQLVEMEKANVVLIVPKELHHEYPPQFRDGLNSFEHFLSGVRTTLSI